MFKVYRKSWSGLPAFSGTQRRVEQKAKPSNLIQPDRHGGSERQAGPKQSQHRRPEAGRSLRNLKPQWTIDLFQILKSVVVFLKKYYGHKSVSKYFLQRFLASIPNITKN